MSLVLIDNNDPWLAEYNTCEKLYQTIVDTLQLRNNQPKNSDEYSRISARIRVQLKQYSNEVNQLKAQLQNITSNSTLTRDEIERRQRLLEQLQSSNVKITNMYNNRPSYAAQRNELLVDAGTTGWGDDASDEESPLLGGGSNIADVREQQQMMIQGGMFYEDIENITLSMLEDEDVVQDIHLNSKFNLLHPKTSIMEEDEGQGHSVFCQQTVRTASESLGMSLELSDKEVVQLADDISYVAMDVIQSCKRHMMMTRQSRLTSKMLKEILARSYGYKSYGHRTYYEEEEESIQKQCEKQFVQVGSSKSKKLYINEDAILSCLDLDVITYCNAPFYVSQSWLFPSEEYTKHPYSHLDKQYYQAILDIVFSPLEIPFLKLVNDFDINRVALKLINCTKLAINEFAKNVSVLHRLLNFLIALANSKYLISPAYTYVCLSLLRMAVNINTKEFVSDGSTLPLTYSIRRKAAALVADMVRHWDIGPHYIMDITTRVNKSSPEYKELLSHSGAVSILSALGKDIFKYSIFYHVADLFVRVKKLHTLRIQSAQGDRRVMQKFYEDVCNFRDVLFHAVYQLYESNTRVDRRFLDGDSLMSGYFVELGLMMRHVNYNAPFQSSAVKVFNPDLVVDVAAFSQGMKNEKPKMRHKDEDARNLNSLLHIGVHPVTRSENYACFDGEIMEPLLQRFSEHIQLSYKDRQLLVDDVYYRVMHILQTNTTRRTNPPSLKLTDLRARFLSLYPAHFIRPLNRKNVAVEFEDYKLQRKCHRIKININNCMRRPEYRLKRSVSYSRRAEYYAEEDRPLGAHYRHQIYCRRKNIKDLKFDPKQHVCSSLLSVML